nr:dTDP-4-dehydrorhamnose 3,5-epimerase [Lachnospiraceae bacterium]
VVRGLHFQTRNPQSKYVCVVSGKAWDVIVDLRKDSDTYKKWAAFELSAENGCGLYIPAGFAHGFLSLEDNTAMLYQCEGKYDKETDTGITVFDKDIAIDWPVLHEEVTLSDRDKTFMDLKYYEDNDLLNEFRVKNG